MEPEQQQHHKKAEVATDRPSYRQARWEKAVKVYTVNQESKYLLVQNVHALGVSRELQQQFSVYGAIEECQLLDDYPSEPFTEVYRMKFAAIDSARIAKKKLDNRSFYGKDLHVCYAPEFESVQDTREKLEQRRRVIAWKTRGARSSGAVGRGSHGDFTQSGTSSLTLASPSSAAITPLHPASTPPITPTAPLQITAQSLPIEPAPLIQSHDSHMTQFPLLPAPPLPHHPMHGYPSALQGSESGRPAAAGQPGTGRPEKRYGSGSGMGPPGSGMGPPSGASHGARPHSGVELGFGVDQEERLFDPAGLSTEDRVAAYLAAEIGGGFTGVGEGGKRAAADSGEAIGSNKKPRKRKRI